MYTGITLLKLLKAKYNFEYHNQKAVIIFNLVFEVGLIFILIILWLHPLLGFGVNGVLITI
jgi:hypothetical protein